MIRLAIASLRHRVAAVTAILLAVVIGAGLFAASGAIFETALRLDAPPQSLGGAPVVVAGPASYEFANHSGSASLPERSGLDPTLTRRIADRPRVSRAVPYMSFPAVLLRDARPVRPGADPLAGHDWSSAALTPYTLHGSAPTDSHDVVLDAVTARSAGVRVGERVRVAVDGVPDSYVVTGLARPGRSVRDPALFFADSRGHAPTAIGVWPAPGTSTSELATELRRALPAGVTVRTGTARGDAENTGVGGSRLPLIILAAVFGGLVVVVMGIVVAAITTLSIRRRHRELALLRALGATPFQTGRLVLAEALVVAVLGATGGALLGRPVGRALFAALRNHHVIPAALTFAQGPLPCAAGFLVAVGAVWFATRLAARPAGRVPAIEALREAELPPVTVHPLRRVLAGTLGVGTLALAVATMFMSPANASALGGPAVLTGSVALALVAPVAVQRAAARYARSRRGCVGIAGRLATVNLRARAVQYGAVLTPITIATAIALGNIYSQTTQDDAARAAYLDTLHADVVVESSAGGIPAGVIEQLARLRHVTAASGIVTSEGWLEQPFDGAHTSDPLRLLGIDAPTGRAADEQVYSGHVHDGSLARLRPGTVALPHALAAGLHVDVGDRVAVRLGDGARLAATVIATIDQPAGYEQLVLPAGELAAHTTSRLPTQLVLRTDDPVAVARVVRRALPAVTLGGPELLRSRFDAGLDIQAWINYLVAALALAYAALATINTLAVSILDRRREFGLQRLTGATRRDVTRMLYREVGLVGTLGWAAGAVIAVFTVWPIAIASGRVVPSGPLWVLVASIGATAVLLLPVTDICARVAMRQPAGFVVAATDA